MFLLGSCLSNLYADILDSDLHERLEKVSTICTSHNVTLTYYFVQLCQRWIDDSLKTNHMEMPDMLTGLTTMVYRLYDTKAKSRDCSQLRSDIEILRERVMNDTVLPVSFSYCFIRSSYMQTRCSCGSKRSIRTVHETNVFRECHACAGGFVDYGMVTDALVYGYMTKIAGLDFANEVIRNCLGELHTIRVYVSYTAKRERAHKEQCYFVTHLVYVFSHYGRVKLNPALFKEEISFIIDNMSIVCSVFKVGQKIYY